MTRDGAMVSLLTLLSAGGAYKTTGRRLLLWDKVPEQPALFLRHVGDDVPARRSGMPPRVTMECEAWIYSNAGQNPDVAPEAALNDLLDGIDLALRPPPGLEAQTLGGAVIHAWPEGRVEIHPGDLDGQAIAIVPIKILVPITG